MAIAAFYLARVYWAINQNLKRCRYTKRKDSTFKQALTQHYEVSRTVLELDKIITFFNLTFYATDIIYIIHLISDNLLRTRRFAISIIET